MTRQDPNLRHWDRFADIDPKFTKAITGKPYKGTSPNPQYVIRCLTEIFGPVGEGFGWRVIVEGFQPLGDEVLHWCRIEFWHTDRMHAFEAYGQTKALAKTRNGMMLDEDAPKKSLTDAIIKAASHVGVAANIFLGRWDDQKYIAEVAAEYRRKEKAPAAIYKKSAVESTIEAIAECASLPDLADLWKSLPNGLKSLPEVFGAKDNRKAELMPHPADSADADEIPYEGK